MHLAARFGEQDHPLPFAQVLIELGARSIAAAAFENAVHLVLLRAR
jgi:hypothetical protein